MGANKRAQDRNGDESGDGAGAGTATGVNTRGQTHDGNGNGSGEGHESSSGDGDGDVDGNGNENEDRIEEGGREAKKRIKPHKNYRRHVGNGGDFGGKGRKRLKERVGPVAGNPDNLENNKEAGEGEQCTQDWVFVRSIIDLPSGGSMRRA